MNALFYAVDYIALILGGTAAFVVFCAANAWDIISIVIPNALVIGSILLFDCVKRARGGY